MDQKVKTLETVQAEEALRMENRLKIVEDRTTFSDSISFEMQNELENLMTRIELLEKNTAKISQGYLRSGETNLPALTDEEYRTKYISALASYQNGEYAVAEKAFHELIQINPLHDLADNSQYWIGEIYYARKNYRQALEEFQKVMDFKDSNKADHALFKIGLCYLNIGDTKQAKATFLTHITKYPNSELYSRSKSYLDQN
ncbi:MAG: tetratricopeptide repeat protein [FCB group bacterium]|nr:tetratricopeptide repeat protein [FCB group bacterium]